MPCSERIHVAVTEMAALFPKVSACRIIFEWFSWFAVSLTSVRRFALMFKIFALRCFILPLQKPRSETVRGSLRLLTSSACRLQSECRKALPSEGCPGPDMQLVTQQVIQCAYDIAKAAKQLVTITTKENTN